MGINLVLGRKMLRQKDMQHATSAVGLTGKYNPVIYRVLTMLPRNRKTEAEMLRGVDGLHSMHQAESYLQLFHTKTDGPAAQEENKVGRR